MKTVQAETVIGTNGELHLKDLPFAKGENVHVIILTRGGGEGETLEGTVLKYTEPFSPVAPEDWEATK